MSKSKKKVRRLTAEQYNAYISTLKSDAALYSANGETYIPPQIDDIKPKPKPQGE